VDWVSFGDLTKDISLVKKRSLMLMHTQKSIEVTLSLFLKAWVPSFHPSFLSRILT